MHSMTLEQLRAAASAGGVKSVTLKGQGGGFFIEIAIRSGQNAVLAKARSIVPRRFGSPTSALIVLRDVGIAVAQIDATNWNPDQKDMTRSRLRLAEAMRDAHEAAAYNQWLAGEIQAAIDDPRPSIPHDDVMAEIAAGRHGRLVEEKARMTAKSCHVEWRPMAQEDLRAIMRHIGKDNPAPAKRFGLELRDKTKSLAQYPELGRQGRPGLPDWLRELVVHPNYIVFYRVLTVERTVQILRVKHAAQQMP